MKDWAPIYSRTRTPAKKKRTHPPHDLMVEIGAGSPHGSNAKTVSDDGDKRAYANDRGLLLDDGEKKRLQTKLEPAGQ